MQISFSIARQHYRSGVLLLVMIMTIFVTLMQADAATLPSGFAEKQITNILSTPTAMEIAPDGRIFVCEQGGSLRVVKNDTLLAQPFLTISVDNSGERGLLGVTFDPDFATNHYVYIYYTTSSLPIHNRVSRFIAEGDTAQAGSEVILFELDNLNSATNHNGGAIHFGPDGKLYIATGENANTSNSQTLTNLLGKILRINSDGTIPSDNPFFGSATGNNRAIWVLGLRNPFTFTFQPGTGRMFINDVGQAAFEEIDDGIAGSNYGWPTTEGYTANPSFRGPVYAYGHGSTDSTGCAITGGAFYNPSIVQFPGSYVGDYFYVEYCTGWIRRFHPIDSTTSSFASGLLFSVGLTVDSAGSLYYLSRNLSAGAGSLVKIQYSSSLPPTILTEPTSVTVADNQPATFSISASGYPTLLYQWQRNGSNIVGATSSSYTLSPAVLADSGALFRCIVSNPYGADTSIQATLTVVSNLPPIATINLPTGGTLYSGGDTIFYAGTGTDPETGALPLSAYTWQVDLHHDAHVHPFIPPTSGITGGSFIIPTTGHTEENVWYRIYLTVVDSQGLPNTTFREIFPRKSTDTLTTVPPGLQVELDGVPSTSPMIFTGVVGIVRAISVTSPYTLGGQTYQFSSWSDGGALNHIISTPSANTKYIAVFEPNPTVPVLSSPVNSATNQPQSLTLVWHPGNGATKYSLQVSADSTFATTIVDDTTIADTSSAVSGLANSTTYYWHVKSTNLNGTSLYSAFSRFTTTPSLSITTVSPLPNATAGIVYTDTLRATGGISPLNWSAFSGSLPSGISLLSSGVLTGTPSVAGSYSFTAQVNDNVSSTATKAFSITVNAGGATHLVFAQQPSDGIVSTTIVPPITVQVKDANDNNTTGAGISISLTLLSGTGTINGTTTHLSDATGLSTFNDITISTAGTKVLSAVNRGLTSATSVSFTISNPLPSLSTISPTTATAGDPGFTLTVNGAGFISGSVVRFNGADRITTFINPNQLTASLVAGDLTTAGTFLITVFTPSPGGGISTTLPFTVLRPIANIKIMLQGPFNGGAMTTTLRDANIIPHNQPYNSSPWNYSGTENVSSLPPNVVDWILIELRTGTSSGTTVASRAGFVKNNGAVVDTDGTNPVTFSGIVAGNYYIVIKHRNHLAVMSASPVLLTSTSALYDFTTGTSKYFGGDAKNLGSAVFGMYAGDYSQDGFVDSDDFTGPDNEVFQSGYRRSDLNLDGFVDSGDFIDPDNNVFKSTLIPN